MAIVGTVTWPVKQTGITCFGISGTEVKHCDVDIILTFECHDDNVIYVSVSGTISNDTLPVGDYPVFLQLGRQQWSWNSNAAGVTSLPPAVILAQDTVKVEDGKPFRWSLPVSNVEFCRYADLEIDDSDKYLANVYLSGTSSNGKSPDLFPTPSKLQIRNLATIYDYYPWAVKNDDWKSCNRSGGLNQARNGDVWEDRKNSEDGSSRIQVWYRAGMSWIAAPKVGNE